MNRQTLPNLLRLTRPFHAALGLLTYALGLGIAHYLGATLRPEVQFFGGVIVMLVLAAGGLLREYFRPFNEPLIAGETIAEREALKRLLMPFALAFLGVGSVLFFLLQLSGLVNLGSAFLFVVLVLSALASALPPMQLARRGFGEIIDAFLMASLSPTLAFFLSMGDFHRLLSLFSFPLFLIVLACLLALNFPAYADDVKYERRSLLTSLTWQHAVRIHQLLLGTAYLILVAGPFLGINWGLLWPVLLTLPLAIYQMWTLHNIEQGVKPFWQLLRLTAFALMGLVAYLMTMSFWMG